MKKGNYNVEVMPMNRNIVIMQATATTINSLIKGTVSYIKNKVLIDGIYVWVIYDNQRDRMVKSGMVATSKTKTQFVYPDDFKFTSMPLIEGFTCGK